MRILTEGTETFRQDMQLGGREREREGWKKGDNVLLFFIYLFKYYYFFIY